MPDWNAIVRERIAPLRLDPAAEASLAEELAQHLEDTWRELSSSGIDESGAYAATLAELDHAEALRAARPRSDRAPARDPVPPGDARAGLRSPDLNAT